MPGSGNESNHVVDGLTVKGGIKVGDAGPYISAGDSPWSSVEPPRGGGAGLEVPAPRKYGARTSFNTATQSLRLTNFLCPKDMTVATLSVSTDATAAGATPTIIRYGLYSIANDGGITLIGSTPNDTTMLASTLTAYPKALSTPVAISAGNRYALGFLIVTAAAAPSLRSPDPTSTAVIDSADVLARPANAIAAQADLPASVAIGSLTSSGTGIYWYLT